MLQNAVNETAVTMASTFERNTASNELAKHRNQACNEALFEVCFSQIGPAGTAQLLPCGGRNVRATTKIQRLQGRVPQDFQQVCGPINTFGARAKAPGALKRGHVGIKGQQSVAAPLPSDFCKSDHLQVTISHLWTFNVAKCCQRNSRDNGLNIRKKHGV